MALLKEYNSFTHVVDIDFGRGLQGKIGLALDLQLRRGNSIRRASLGLKCSILVMVMWSKDADRHPF